VSKLGGECLSWLLNNTQEGRDLSKAKKVAEMWPDILKGEGQACELEVPLGMGNSLTFEVISRCNTEDQKSPSDQL
jgi:hypothetical protein